MPEDSPSPAIDLSAIKAEPISDGSDALAQGEFNKYRSERLQAELDDFKSEVENRRVYTSRLFWLMVAWITVVLGILIATGIEAPPSPVDNAGAAAASPPASLAPEPGVAHWIGAFKLSDAVLMTLIGGTTANVIGLFLVVAAYLFPRRSKVPE